MHGGYLTDQVRVRVRLTNSSLSICRKRTNYKCLIIKLQYITEDVNDKRPFKRRRSVYCRKSYSYHEQPVVVT
jgi:hypothetical protein